MLGALYAIARPSVRPPVCHTDTHLPYNLYCVGGDVKHCSIQSNPSHGCISQKRLKLGS